MKNIRILILCATGILLASSSLKAQDFGITFSGYVKNDFFFDSRQTVSAREGHFLLWPSQKVLGTNGDDINSGWNFNALAVQSRLSGRITGPDAFGATSSGLIEGDFFAQANDNINLLRLRHAYVKLEWENSSLLMGQYWNPLFVTSCFPGTVSFNTGTPLQSFARNPQVRFSYTAGKWTFLGAALSQRDYTSRGVNGVGSEYLRNAGIPDLHYQMHFQAGKLVSGLGVAYKTLVPRLSSTVGANSYKVDEKVGGLTAIAFAKLTANAVTLKMQGRYGENIADVLSISGFAVKEVVDGTTGEQSYTPLRNATVWAELHTNGETFQFGLFGGYLKNLGTGERLSDPSNAVYGLGTNIESLFRLAPRVLFNSGKTRLAAELEYTSAAFGSGYDEYKVPVNTTKVANLRLLLSAYYLF